MAADLTKLNVCMQTTVNRLLTLGPGLGLLQRPELFVLQQQQRLGVFGLAQTGAVLTFRTFVVVVHVDFSSGLCAGYS